MQLEIVASDRPAPPHPLDDFLPPDEASRVGGEKHDQIEYQGLNVLRHAVEAELVSVSIEFELVKLVTHRIPHQPTLAAPDQFPVFRLARSPIPPRNLQTIPKILPGSLQASGRRMGHI